LTAVIASSPLWTDKAVAVATIIGVVGGLTALGLSLKQLTLQTRELALQTNQEQKGIEIRVAQRALDLMRLLIEIGLVAVEHPELGPYLHKGKKLPTDEKLLNQVLSYASGFMSVAETVGWQIRADQMSKDSVIEWKRYFNHLYDSAPAVRSVVERDSTMLAGETLWLFGLGRITESLLRLGFEE
jgi:hypothetical protein